MMYAHCTTAGLIEISGTIPQGEILIAQGDEVILRQAIAAAAVRHDCGWQLPEGTPDEQADARTVIANFAALLAQEKAFNEKYPVGATVVVETITKKDTRSGHKTTIKINKRRIMGKAVVVSGDVLVPVRQRGKRVLVSVSSIQTERASA